MHDQGLGSTLTNLGGDPRFLAIVILMLLVLGVAALIRYLLHGRGPVRRNGGRANDDNQ